MKSSTCVTVFLVVVFCLPEMRATTLPDSCGSDKVEFKVSTKKHQSLPALTDPNKALVVLVEEEDKLQGEACWGCNFTTRIGIDGAWAGANKGSSYFAVTVAPGVHHICVNWQSVIGMFRRQVGLTEFNAEPGQTYYFDTKIKESPGLVTGSGNDVMQDSQWTLNLEKLNRDQGLYRVQTSALAKSAEKR